MWIILLPVALLLFFSYIGRQVRRGRIPEGRWIQQFRVVRSVISLALLGAAGLMVAHGQWMFGLICLILAFVAGGTVRISGRIQTGQTRPVTAASYTSEEIRAYQTLGLPVGADRKAIKEAWKRLMKTAHPDQGGDVGRASALNAARDILLKRRG